jgi:hypothetical protein
MPTYMVVGEGNVKKVRDDGATEEEIKFTRGNVIIIINNNDRKTNKDNGK